MNERIPSVARAGLLALAMAPFTTGCVVPVDEDGPGETHASVSELATVGACANGSLSEIEISLMLSSDHGAVTSEDSLAGEDISVGRQLSPANFQFSQSPNGADFLESQAFAEGASGSTVGADLRPVGLDYIWNGGEERRDDDRLVVFLMDQSGSLIGRDPVDGVDTNHASDREDERIVFFRQLLGDLDKDSWVSLVYFNRTFNSISEKPNLATPTRNRDAIQEGLDTLNQVALKEGQSPLAKALLDTKNRIISIDHNADLNPTVVLFTDGVERGDPSSIPMTEVISEYAAAGIPVIVLHLQPRDPEFKTRGSAELARLACESGGEYIYLRNSSEFTSNPMLPAIVRNRIEGVWRLKTKTSMSKDEIDDYLLSGQLEMTLGEKSESTAFGLETEDNGSTLRDNRLRLFKR